MTAAQPPLEPPRRRRGLWWARLGDADLLRVRFRDLDLELEHTPIAKRVRQLHRELAARGIDFEPHAWLAKEWFSPDGVPGIAVPFYLAHPRLGRLERQIRGEVEGGNAAWCMRLLRHEAGHALDTAYRLRRRRAWREVFGPAALPYPRSYWASPASHDYVQHLGGWYAQSHPTEDFAETFAVWLKPHASWRRDYAGWPAMAKLEYVDTLLQEIADREPTVRARVRVEALSADTETLGEHYARLQRGVRVSPSRRDDELLRSAFSAPRAARAARAAVVLRRLRRLVHRRLTKRLGCSDYLLHQVLRAAIARADDLDLRASAGTANPRRVERLVARLVRGWQGSPRRRQLL
jgi:hypothetical protein